ncbi:hypothetical protein AKJ09_02504 [Labilithrix luteola]|uniref:Uncharacterized protein n=1 Tax=Labilithrix luteola TaxID=1391654 RepID=A0A0K1PQM2_9BACT|nr:hypothetical protein [Labilithrix luteola]AKU95840.1 hypothetical protein AKJ09_02504 [Labilithrix luteola]
MVRASATTTETFIACVLASGPSGLASRFRAVTVALVGLAFAGAIVGCGSAPPPPPRPREPPPRTMVVNLPRITLRATSYAELHAWLAAAARSSEPLPDADLEASRKPYARALRDDVRDDLLATSLRAIADCDTDRCAHDALGQTPFGPSFDAALPMFVAREWTTRADVAQAGIDASRAAMGVELEPLVMRLSKDLGIAWPESGATVPVVSQTPDVGREALVPVALSARGSCFVGTRGEEPKLRDARVIDCVLTLATLSLRSKSAFATALASELSPREADRAWQLTAIHAVAATVTAWAPKHVSAMRKSALAVEEPALNWLAENWRARANGESIAMFAHRWAEAYRDTVQAH